MNALFKQVEELLIDSDRYTCQLSMASGDSRIEVRDCYGLVFRYMDCEPSYDYKIKSNLNRMGFEI